MGIVAVDYVVDGPRSASAVTRGETRLCGMAITVPGEEPLYVERDLSNILQLFGPLPRVYHNAIFARTIERVYDLPSIHTFDDTRTMASLAGQLPQLDGELNGRGPCGFMCAQTRARRILEAYMALQTCFADQELAFVYSRIELPVVDPTVAMIVHGMNVDTEILGQIRCGNATQLEILEEQISEVAGQPLNPKSSEDIADFLYRQCDFPVTLRTTNGNPSTRAEALHQLANRHPVIPLLLDYRSHWTALTAAESVHRYVSNSSGRLHAELDTLGTDTGRYTCCSPNVQAVPTAVKKVFRATEGHLLLELDISQAELRVLAHFSQEPSFIRAFQAGDVDIHRRTAAMALRMPEEAVTPAQRNSIGKVVNFGVIYGETECGLSEHLGVSFQEARAFIQTYFQGYAGVRDWVEAIKNHAHQYGYVNTLYGRRRDLPQIWSADPAAVSRAERQAVNTVIQGTAADIIKLAIARIHQSLPEDCWLLMTVHDSVLLEVPEHRVHELEPDLRSIMEQPPPGFSVPIRVDAKVGRTWGQLESKAELAVQSISVQDITS